MNRPIFLLSSERGGSNLISKIFNAHNDIAAPTTKHLLNPIFRNAFRYEPIEDNWETLVEDFLTLYKVPFAYWRTEVSKSELMDNVPAGSIKGLVSYVYEKEIKELNKGNVFLKEIKVYEIFDYLINFFPDAQFVYLYRDPRDVALSWKKSLNHKGGVVAAARQWKIDQQQYLKFQYLYKDAFYRVSYEGLITDAQAALSPFLSKVGLSWDDEMLNFHKDSLTAKNSESNASWSNLSKAIDPKNQTKYLKELSEHEIKLIEYLCGFEMLELGYQPVNDIAKLQLELKGGDAAAHHDQEVKSLTYEPIPGVQLNMDAKKTFYEKSYHLKANRRR